MTESAGDRPRVLIIVQNLPVPLDRRVWLEATTLTRAGYLVSVICPKAEGFDASYEVIEDIHVYRYRVPVQAQGLVGFVAEFIWCFFRTLMKLLRVCVAGRGFDVLHACNPPETFWPLAYLIRPFGKRFIFDHHDLSPELYLAKFDRPVRLVHSTLLFLERMTFRAADVVITTNESYKRIAMERGGVEANDVFIVRSGPDVDRLSTYEPDPSWRRGKRHMLTYLGEMCKQDGVDHLVRALRVMRDDLGRNDIHCVFVGGGPHQQTIEAYAHELGVADMCTFTGRVSDEMMSRILSSADVGVDPDPKNDFNDKCTMNKIMEYLFFGLPVVCYDLAEHRVSAGPAALYVEPNREVALAAGIVTLLEDAERRQEMGRTGQERFRSMLAWDHSAPRLLAAYERVVPRGQYRGAEQRPRHENAPSNRVGPRFQRNPEGRKCGDVRGRRKQDLSASTSTATPERASRLGR
ncbi:MAG: glycosyltransferase family 4 protein [Actinomycetota bacterium]|nr:glycosyltransferase family 4 protein [Actinomycetota bacterium]